MGNQQEMNKTKSYEAPKVVEIGQIGSTLQGARMSTNLDGGFAMTPMNGTVGLTTAI
jgi:hypothetical protein